MAIPETEAAAVLRHWPYWQWSAAVQLSRLPVTMAPLAFTVLTTAMTGSYQVGAAMMVALVVGQLTGAVPAGRLLDIVGPRRGVLLLLLVSAAAVLALVVTSQVTTATWPLFGMVAVLGLVSGGLNGGFRSLLAAIVPSNALVRATSVDAMIMEGVIIAGPALVAVLARPGAMWPLAAMAAAYLLGMVGVPRGRGPAEAVAASAGARGSIPWARASPWLACLFVVGHLLSTIEVGALPLAQRLGAGSSGAALLIAVLSVASIAGSALYAWRGEGKPRAALVSLASLAAGAFVVAPELGWPAVVTGLVLVGACTGPLLSLSNVQLLWMLPSRRRSEGLSLAYVIQSIGFAFGSFSLSILPLPAAILLGGMSAVIAAGLLLGSRQLHATPAGTNA